MRRTITSRGLLLCLCFAFATALSVPVMAQGSKGEKKGGEKKAAEEAKKEEEKPKLPWEAYEEFARANKYVAYGGLSRAVKHYKRALAVDPENYAIAHFNLGEIYLAKENCADAIVHYQIYVSQGRDEEAIGFAKEGVAKCKKLNPTWAKLSLRTERKYPKEGADELMAEISVRGYVLSREGKLEGFVLPPKLPSDKEDFEKERREREGFSGQADAEKTSYEISVTATDFMSNTFELTAPAGEAIERSVTLERMTFYGTLAISVDVEGSSVKLTPKTMDKPTETPAPFTGTSPLTKELKLPTGKYLLEVNREGYDRWIRHVYVTKENAASVTVSLVKSLPPEIQ